MDDPEMKPCPECGGRRVWVSYLYTGGVLLKQPGRSPSRFSSKKQNYSNTSALACTVCGYTSIYADQPGNLIPDD